MTTDELSDCSAEITDALIGILGRMSNDPLKTQTALLLEIDKGANTLERLRDAFGAHRFDTDHLVRLAYRGCITVDEQEQLVLTAGGREFLSSLRLRFAAEIQDSTAVDAARLHSIGLSA